ncbi:MAG: hypothetical protein M1370_01415 [Bacteroidetes bacterium]|nr:hypothetical protein [Bacteroidota bacterium]MCL5025497.1 hypothetical protein [Chloroflexota bacterium]
MRRVALIFFLVTLALMAIAPAASAGEISFEPAAGTPDTSFKFTGFGFDAGARIGLSARAPDGQEFTPPGPDGGPFMLDVDDTGHFYLEVVPSRDFPVAQEGSWTIIFTDTSNGDVLQAQIEVAS